MRLKLTSQAAAALLAAGCATAPASGTVTGEYLAGRFAARTNAVEAAAGAYGRAHESAPQDPMILKDAFFFHVAAGDIDGAASYARQMLDTDADEDGLATATLAAQALKAGRLDEARALFGRKPGLQFLQSIAFLADVWIEHGLAGPDAALARLATPPQGVFAGFNPLHKALLSERAGKIDDARAAYLESVYGLAGPVGRAAYGAFLERLENQAAALDYYSVLGRDPGPHRRQAEAALLRMQKKRTPTAFANLTPAQGAAIAFHSFAGGMIEQAAEQRARALEAGMHVGEPRFNFPLAMARLAVYLDPDFDEAKRLVGGILNLYVDFDAAAKALEEIPPSSPQFEQARIEIAGGQAGAGRIGDAEKTLRTAIRRDPRSLELRLTLASLLASLDRHEDAVKTMDAVIKTLGENPPDDSWRHFVARGGSNLELGRWEAAEADLKRAVEIAPDEPVALNYLGYSWAERGVNLEEAFALIDKAVAMRPESGAIIDSLGWAHYQLGRYEEAAVHLERAAALEPSDPTITDHLGDVYWRLDRRTEAHFQWRRVLELSPSDQLKAKVQEKLRSGLAEAGPPKSGR